MWDLRVCVFIVMLTFAFVHCKPEMDFGLMIDAGSSGSRLHIYEWPKREDKTIPAVKPAPINQTAWVKKVKPGISAFAGKPQELSENLEPLILFAKSKIPKDRYKDTPLFLLATAGMRLLPLHSQNEILAAIRKKFAVSGFLFKENNARVINGSMEGVFGWVTANYLLGKLDGDAMETKGALDMGGASTQITFHVKDSSDIPEQYIYPLSLGNNNYQLYVWSFLKFGMDAARNRFLNDVLQPQADGKTIINPCMFTGQSSSSLRHGKQYTQLGTSDYSACFKLTHELLNQTKGCPYGTDRCSFNGIFQPKLSGDFLAFSGYFYLINILGLEKNATLDQVKSATSNFCSYTWEKLQEKYKSSPLWNFIPLYCFNGAYVVNVLEAYGFNGKDNDILYLDSIRGAETGWAVGAMIFEANLLAWGKKNHTLLYVSLAIGGIALVVGIIVVVIALMRKRRTSDYEKM